MHARQGFAAIIVVLLSGALGGVGPDATAAPGATTLVSVSGAGAVGNGISPQSVISSDGRFVAFMSTASSLVSGDLPNQDIFRRALQSGTTAKVSVGQGF